MAEIVGYVAIFTRSRHIGYILLIAVWHIYILRMFRMSTGGRGDWRMSRIRSYQLSDDEILQIRMHYGHPRAGFDLLSAREVPDNPEWVGFVAKYICKYSVKCMRPGCGQPHNDGAVVEIKTIKGTTGMINIGHDCGEILFPEEYVGGGTSYDQDLERRRLVTKKREILSKENQIIRWFETTRKPFEEYDKARSEFEAYYPDLLSDIRRALKSRNGALIAWETAGKKFREAAEGIRSQTYTGSAVVHRVMGQNFYSRGDLVDRVDKAARECSELIERLRPNNLPVKEMRECLDSLGKIGERMEKMEEQHRDMFAALSPENLRGLAIWSRRVDQDSPIDFRNNGLFRHADGRLPEHLMAPIKRVDLEPIVAFPLSRAA